jgi:hypothetical protein
MEGKMNSDIDIFNADYENDNLIDDIADRLEYISRITPTSMPEWMN